MPSQVFFGAPRSLSSVSMCLSGTLAAMNSRCFVRMAWLLLALLLPGAACVSARAQLFGSQAIGTTSSVRTVEVVIPAGTVGSIAVLTQGATDLDFANAGGGTCRATTYSRATACTVKVTFTPTAPGLRLGALVFFSGARNSGTQLKWFPFSGIGTGPQVIYRPGTPTAVDPTVNGLSLSQVFGVAVDGAGDQFISDEQENATNRVVEVPKGGGAAIAITPSVNGRGLVVPGNLAVDGAGNLFIADFGNNRIVEVPFGGGAATAIDPVVNGESIDEPGAIAFDAAGDMFIADSNHNRIVEVPANGGPAVAIDPTANGEALNYPIGLAVDGAGDLFITDYDNDRVVEVPAGGGPAIVIDPTVDGSKLFSPLSVAVDAAGDLFIVNDIGPIEEVPAGGGVAFGIDPKVNGLSLSAPQAIALDGAGDLFIADTHPRVVELHQSQPPTLIFPTPTVVGQMDTADPEQTVEIQNNGNANLDFTALSFPVDFSSIGGGPGACDGESTVEPGSACYLSIGFTPKHAGKLTESITLTDNTLNEAGAQQEIPVTGTGVKPAPVVKLSVSNLSFANQKLKTASGAKSVKLTNTGNAPLAIHSIAIGGSDLKDFKETNKCAGSLAAKASCTVEVTFEPLVKGELAAKLVIEDNAKGSPQDVSLTGKGVASN